jgi:hypothetical protein
MNNEQLKRSLQSIGMACFVKYFPQFSDASLSNEDLIELLIRRERYMESGCKTRVTQSRRIIANGRAKDALLLVASSARVPDDISTAAGKLAHSFQR